ncbi:MAG TPA: DUF1552 domain-containing protein [Vicinamibacterales bacterium]|nr:DUF1552 domain-containing protein [Vicinamibacterales bacterium]
MMVFRKAIPRRTFLRGAGTALALPLLDAMVPAFASAAQIAATRAARLSFFAVPNGIIMDKWTPTAAGSGFPMTPVLEPLAAFRDRMVVIGGLANNEARKLEFEIAGDHPRACSAYLTATHPKMTSGADIHCGVSVDQVAAKALGRQTPLPSLEIGLETPMIGACESAYSCVYYNTLAWRGPETPMPMENRPRAVFERLVGDSTDPAERSARLRENRSILDLVSQDLARLMRSVGQTDRLKLDQYSEAVRSVEQQIQVTEQQAPKELPDMEKPIGIPEKFSDYTRLMLDLQVLAFQGDMTRVSTFMVGHEMGGRAYPELGFGDQHHSLTHHQGDKAKIEKIIQINVFHATLYQYFLEKMRSIPDGDGSLLDRSLLVYGSPLSDGNMHLYRDLPVLLVAGAATGIAGNRHVRYPDDTPMANLYLTLLDRLGVDIERFGDSTGRVAL